LEADAKAHGTWQRKRTRCIDVNDKENEKDIKKEENKVELEQIVDWGNDEEQSEYVKQVSL